MTVLFLSRRQEVGIGSLNRLWKALWFVSGKNGSKNRIN